MDAPGSRSMVRFEYAETATIDEAVACSKPAAAAPRVRRRHRPAGADQEHMRAPAHVINIKKIPGLDDLDFDRRSGLRIGALTTARAIETLAGRAAALCAVCTRRSCEFALDPGAQPRDAWSATSAAPRPRPTRCRRSSPTARRCASTAPTANAQRAAGRLLHRPRQDRARRRRARRPHQRAGAGAAHRQGLPEARPPQRRWSSRPSASRSR